MAITTSSLYHLSNIKKKKGEGQEKLFKITYLHVLLFIYLDIELLHILTKEYFVYTHINFLKIKIKPILLKSSDFISSF